MTIDQRGSRTHGDKVPGLLALLAGVDAAPGFERSVGDEIQGVLREPAAVVEVAVRALRERDWYVGIGIGRVELPLPASPREGAGDAFVAAREAVEAAKKTGERVPLCVRTPHPGPTDWAGDWAGGAEAVMVLLGDIVRKRSAAEWRVLDALEAAPGSSQKDIARQLGITPQAVSKSILRSGRNEVSAGIRAAAILLEQALLEQALSTHNVGGNG